MAVGRDKAGSTYIYESEGSAAISGGVSRRKWPGLVYALYICLCFIWRRGGLVTICVYCAERGGVSRRNLTSTLFPGVLCLCTCIIYNDCVYYLYNSIVINMIKLTPYTMITVKPNPKLGYPFTQRQMTLRQAWDVIKGKPEYWFTLTAHEYHYMGTKRKKISSQGITYQDIFNNA